MCLCISGYRKPTPQAALNIIIDLPKLDIFVKCTAPKYVLNLNKPTK